MPIRLIVATKQDRHMKGASELVLAHDSANSTRDHPRRNDVLVEPKVMEPIRLDQGATTVNWKDRRPSCTIVHMATSLRACCCASCKVADPVEMSTTAHAWEALWTSNLNLGPTA